MVTNNTKFDIIRSNMYCEFQKYARFYIGEDKQFIDLVVQQTFNRLFAMNLLPGLKEEYTAVLAIDLYTMLSYTYMSRCQQLSESNGQLYQYMKNKIDAFQYVYDNLYQEYLKQAFINSVSFLNLSMIYKKLAIQCIEPNMKQYFVTCFPDYQEDLNVYGKNIELSDCKQLLNIHLQYEKTEEVAIKKFIENMGNCLYTLNTVSKENGSSLLSEIEQDETLYPFQESIAKYVKK